MEKIDDFDLLTVYRSTRNEDPECFTTKWDCDIFLCKYDDNYNESREKIGTATFYLYNIESCKRHYCWLDDVPNFCDDDFFLNNFIDWDNEEILPIWKRSMAFNRNILNIDTIKILPKYRGNGYSKLVVNDIFDKFYGSFGLMASIIFPLQFGSAFDGDKEMEYSLFESDFESAKKNIQEYFREMGFKRYKKSDVFYLSTRKGPKQIDKL